MIPTPSGNVYLATGSTDMRKSINTLGLLVEDVLALDPVG
ncbi:IS66 family insertion sequence element accessory protein TnpB, partial [Salinivibrio costicola]